MSSIGMGRDVHSDAVYPAFPQLTTASPILQGAPKDGFGEAVVKCDASFRHLTVARRGYCRSTREL